MTDNLVEKREYQDANPNWMKDVPINYPTDTALNVSNSLSYRMAENIANNNTYQNIDIPSPAPVYTDPATKPSPTFLESVGYYFAQNNEFTQTYDYFATQNRTARSQAYDDEVHNFNVWDFNNFSRYPKRYWPLIAESKSPEDLYARHEYINNKMAQDEYYQNSSYKSAITGSILGMAFSPTSWIPMAAGAKYAKFGTAMLQNLRRTAPSMVMQTAAHEALMYNTNVGETKAEAIENLAIGSIVGLGFSAIGTSLGQAGIRAKRAHAEGLVKLAGEGVEIGMHVNERGEIVGFQALPNENTALSAAKTDEIQLLLDAAFEESGAFQLPFGAGTFLKKTASAIDPKLRGLLSPFKSMRNFTNEIAEHSYVTSRILEGQANKESMETELARITANTLQLNSVVRGLYFETNGIDGVGKSLKAVAKEMAGGMQMTYSDFSEAIHNVLVTGEKHANNPINVAADLYRKHMDEHMSRYLKSLGYSGELLSPRTAVGYAMRMYNGSAVNADKESFVDTVVASMEAHRQRIDRLHAPLNQIADEIKSTRELIQAGLPQKDELRKELKSLYRRQKQAREDFYDAIEHEDNHILLEDRLYLNRQDRKEMTKLFEPQEKIKTQQKTLKATKDKKQKELYILTRRLEKPKISKAKEEEVRASIDEVKNFIDSTKTKLGELETQLATLNEELMQKVDAGKINKKFYMRDEDNAFIKWHNHEELPKLRQIPESNFKQIEIANAFRNTILGNSPEKIQSMMLNQVSGQLSENATLPRSVMIEDVNLMPFLQHDISKQVASYTRMLAKKTLMQERFRTVNTMQGVKGITNLLAKERTQKELLIDQKSERLQKRIDDAPKEKQTEQFNKDIEKERKAIQKERTELQRDFNKTKKDMSSMYDIWMGNSEKNETLRKASRTLRNLAVMKSLGNVPLTMLTDIGAIILKNGLWNFFKEGAIPMLRQLFHSIFKTGEHDLSEMKGYAADAAVALDHNLHGYQTKMFNEDAMDDVPIFGKLGTMIEKGATISGNIYGTNYAQSALEMLTAQISQGRFMRYMEKHLNGTLKKGEKEALLIYGLDPEKWAKVFIEQGKKHGGKTSLGSWSSMFHNWDNAAANDAMGSAIFRATRDAVIKRGLYDSPFWTNDPIAKMLTLFQGYAFSAFTRYTIPSLQRPDLQKLIGVTAMLSLGLMVEPLRRLAKGEEFDMDDSKGFGYWFQTALSDSGVLGWPVEEIQNVNAAMHGTLLGGVQNDRYKNRTMSGILGGPIAGMADDVVNIMEMFWTGRINEQGMKKAMRFMPYSQAWYLRRGSNAILKSMELPERKSEAEPWPLEFFQNKE